MRGSLAFIDGRGLRDIGDFPGLVSQISRNRHRFEAQTAFVPAKDEITAITHVRRTNSGSSLVGLFVDLSHSGCRSVPGGTAKPWSDKLEDDA